MPKATRLASLAALLLGCSILSANAGWFDSSTSDKPPVAPAATAAKPTTQPTAMSLDESIRQAQLLRLAGKYDEAINHLSQVMLVAADDPRVISEYGKTLTSMGRAEEAVQFLNRAQQLEPGDWSVYSALGVAYDESGDQRNAQTNYEHALALKPGEPSVLNNYALSRMLAKDPAMAVNLASRAEIANSVNQDPQIARNIAMIRSLAPQKQAGVAVNTPAPSPVPHTSVASAAPVPFVSRSPLAPIRQPVPAAMASSAPHPMNAVGVAQLQPTRDPAQPAADNRVVMEQVPVDPLAGPVDAKVATHAPRSLKSRTVAKAEAPQDAKTAKAEDTNLPAKPVPQAKPDAPKPAASAAKSAPVKDAAAKPAAKTADAKPVAVSVKAKDAIPSLRMSANAY
jgi:Flp pilus assembly protein TadD